MLGNKHWMPAHRCLFAVIWDDRRRKPHSDEVGRMMLNGFHALAHYVLACPFHSNGTLRGKQTVVGVKVFAQWLTCCSLQDLQSQLFHLANDIFLIHHSLWR